MKTQFLKDKTGIIKTYVYEHGLIIIPTSALLTIYKPGTSTNPIVDSQAMTIAGDGLLSYNLTVGNNETVDENYSRYF